VVFPADRIAVATFTDGFAAGEARPRKGNGEGFAIMQREADMLLCDVLGYVAKVCHGFILVNSA